MTNQAHKTAITRRKPSAPMRWLDSQGLLVGRGLDYGSGRGEDARHYHMDAYDPYYAPEGPRGHYDFVTCIYVLNVIPDEAERDAVFWRVYGLLKRDGVAYYAVRNDRRNLNGWTANGTWQGYVEVPEGDLIHKTSGYRLYALTW